MKSGWFHISLLSRKAGGEKGGCRQWDLSGTGGEDSRGLHEIPEIGSL